MTTRQQIETRLYTVTCLDESKIELWGIILDDSFPWLPKACVIIENEPIKLIDGTEVVIDDLVFIDGATYLFTDTDLSHLAEFGARRTIPYLGYLIPPTLVNRFSLRLLSEWEQDLKTLGAVGNSDVDVSWKKWKGE